MNDSDYLTPDERDEIAGLFQQTQMRPEDAFDHHMAVEDSHAVADDLLREARAALLCVNYGTGAPDPRCRCHPCAAARRIDAVLNPEPAEPPTCPVHHGGIAGECVCPEPASECGCLPPDAPHADCTNPEHQGGRR